ncbi:MAG TPA: MerR family transcriptional regulator [Novosphingobium sp.]|nr:MerR family transcriptional regulator [Novosphingobium sp.]
MSQYPVDHVVGNAQSSPSLPDVACMQAAQGEDGLDHAAPNPPHADTGKAADAFRTIGEVSNSLGIRAHVLRYWEEQFPMLRPLKRAGGRRYYRPEDMALVSTIDRLVHREGYTLRGARAWLESEAKAARATARAQKHAEPAPQPAVMAPVVAAGPDRAEALIEGLMAIRARLQRAVDTDR